MNAFKVISIGISAVFCVFLCVPLMANVSGPLCPTIYAGSDGKIEIYWFYPGLHETSAGNLPNNSDIFGMGAPAVGPGRYAVVTRFGLDPPVLIHHAVTYIVNSDPFSELPGDQFTPITLFLGRQTDDGCFSHIREYKIGLDSSVCAFGDFVTVDNIDYQTARHEIWVGLEWPTDTNAAPLIGINYSPTGLDQYILEIEESACPRSEAQQEYLAGIRLLDWAERKDPDEMPADSDEALFFEVLFAKDTGDFLNQPELLDIVGADSLHSSVDFTNNGFICIRANDSITAAMSAFVYLDSSQLPDLSVNPPLLERPFDKYAPNFYNFELVNTGSETVSLQLDYDSLLMRLDPQSLEIEPGEEAVVGLYLLADHAGDSLLNSTITIFTSDNKYPLLYHLKFVISEPTGIAGDTRVFPGNFSVTDAYPNPFNGNVRFGIDFPARKGMLFEVYDILGRRIYDDVLTERSGQAFIWPGRDHSGQGMASGLYFFRFSYGGYSIVKRAVLIK